jgi:FAD/FMN-containing dehydrogenase
VNEGASAAGSHGATGGGRVPEGAAVLERVRGLLGPEGVDPAGAAAPGSDEEMAALLRLAGGEGWRVLPLGAGLGPGMEGPAAKTGVPGGPGLVVSTRRRRGITGYEPADLTLTAEAGTTLDELDREVRGHGQWLSLDPPGGGGITLGGMAATGLGGPLVQGFGRPREHVLGLTLVDGGGRVLSLGGRVVKNVAGFDLVRLAVGSRGTVGVITSLSLRLFPLPAVDRLLVWEREGLEEGWELGRRLVQLPFPIGAVEVVTGEAGGAPAEGVRVLVRVLGSEGGTNRITRELEAVGGAAHDRIEEDGAGARFRALSQAEARGDTLARGRVLPDRLGRLLEALERGSGPSGTPGPRWIALRPGTGELRLGAPADWDEAPLAVRARDLGGGFRVLGGPGRDGAAEGRGTAAGPGSHSRKREIEEGLRKSFDPRGILPGSW